MGKQSTKKRNKLSLIQNNQNARNDYNIETREYKPRAVNHREVERIKGRNKEQKALINQIYSGGDIIVTGEPGTGKTFVSAVSALDMVLNDKYSFKKLILIRPNQPLGPTVGMLKGGLIEKIWPWICPFADAFEHRINKQQLTDMIEVGQIELVLVEHLRGRTFKDSIVLVDEFQNLGETAGKCLMTRKGENSKMILMGDLGQCDLPSNETSALEYVQAVDHIAKVSNVSRPYHWIDLIENERSVESSWWSHMTNELENYNFNLDRFITEE